MLRKPRASAFRKDQDVWEAIQYVVEQQGEPMALFVAEEF